MRSAIASLLLLAAAPVLGQQAYVFESAGAYDTSEPINPALPGTCPDGSLMVGFTGARGGSETLTSTNWTQLVTVNTNGSQAIVARIKQSGDTAPTFDWSGSTPTYGVIACFSGDVYTDLSTIVAHSTTDNGTGTSISLPALTISTDDTLVIASGRKNKTATSNGTTVNDVAGFTEINETAIAGTANVAVWNYVQQTTAANIGATSWTLTGTTESLSRNSIVVSLKTASAAFSCPMDQQCITLTSVAADSPCDRLNDLFMYTIAADDIVVADETMTPGGYPLVVDTDCSFEYDPLGDLSPQYAHASVWDAVAEDYFAEEIDYWVNYDDPVCDSPFTQYLVLDEAMAPINIANVDGAICSDPEGDDLINSLLSGVIPTGLALSGTGDGVLSGTPTVPDEDGETLTFELENIAGETTTQQMTLYVLDQQTVPDLDGDTLEEANLALAAVFLFLGDITFECSSETAGTVIGQDPAAMTTVDPLTSVDVVLARPCGGRGGFGFGFGFDIN